MLRLVSNQERRIVSRRRGPLLFLLFLLAVTLYVTQGGGAFYEKAYAQLALAEARWIRGPNAPLSFLYSQKPATERFNLNGIVFSSSHPIAVINETPCARGEKVAVKVGKRSEIIQCVDIEPAAVKIETLDGETARLSLSITPQRPPEEAAPEDPASEDAPDKDPALEIAPNEGSDPQDPAPEDPAPENAAPEGQAPNEKLPREAGPTDIATVATAAAGS
jgi:hypothetical protein